MLTKYSRLLVAFFAVYFASIGRPPATTFAADEPNLLPVAEADGVSGDAVVGTVVRKWNEERDRHEFTILDEHDDIEYRILSGAGIDRTSLLGKRVALQGRTRVHDSLDEGLVYPEHVRVLGRTARLAAFESESAADDSERVASSIPTDININIGDTMTPYTVGPAGPADPLNGYGIPAYPMPGHGPECESCGPGGCFGGGTFWVGVEYLYWKTSGMYVPPLVTTSPVPTPQTEAGVIGASGTQILVGNDEVLDDHRSGGRLHAGFAWGPQYGVEIDYFRLEQTSATFGTSSEATPIIGIPFFNVNPRDPTNPALFAPSREDAFLISYPDLTSGSVSGGAKTRFEGGGIRALMRLCGHSPGLNCPENRRVELILGYRTMLLEDSLSIRAQSTTLNSTNQQYDILDTFGTKNSFDAVEVGAQVRGHRQRFSYEFLAKVALGNVKQEVTIDGATDITTIGGGTFSYDGGIFTQTSNIGNYSRDQFAVSPELNATIGYAFTKQLRCTLGYNFIYLSRVVRAGDQIDREINQDFFAPPANPFTGPQRPALASRDTSFWAQGVNLGLDFRW